jgi:hypothetical protein
VKIQPKGGRAEQWWALRLVHASAHIPPSNFSASTVFNTGWITGTATQPKHLFRRGRFSSGREPFDTAPVKSFSRILSHVCLDQRGHNTKKSGANILTWRNKSFGINIDSQSEICDLDEFAHASCHWRSIVQTNAGTEQQFFVLRRKTATNKTCESSLLLVHQGSINEPRPHHPANVGRPYNGIAWVYIVVKMAISSGLQRKTYGNYGQH